MEQNKSLTKEFVAQFEYVKGRAVLYCTQYRDVAELYKKRLQAHGFHNIAMYEYKKVKNYGLDKRYDIVGPDLKYGTFESMPEDSYFVQCYISNPIDYYALVNTAPWKNKDYFDKLREETKQRLALGKNRGNAISLQQSAGGTYYLKDYVPPKRVGGVVYPETRQIWNYKSREENTVEKTTDELMQAIARISKDDEVKEIALVAIPPSKVDKASAVRDSIATIKQWYEDGTAYEIYGCSKKIYDCSHMLERTEDIPTAHEGTRSTFDRQKEATGFNDNKDISKTEITFIIMDDVLTYGTSMGSCTSVLMENGIADKNIRKLVVSKTIDHPYV